MKQIIFLLISTLIIIKFPSSFEPCNTYTTRQSIPPKIFAEQTIDGKDQKVLVTRFLHNKAGMILSHFGRCYLTFYDPVFILSVVSFPGLFSWAYFSYNVFSRKNLLLISILLTVPIIPYFNGPISFPITAFKIFAIIGLLFLAKLNEEKKQEPNKLKSF